MWKATEAQFNVVRALPAEAVNWDVYVGMHDSILDIQVSFVRELVFCCYLCIRDSILDIQVSFVFELVFCSYLCVVIHDST